MPRHIILLVIAVRNVELMLNRIVMTLRYAVLHV